MVLSRCVLRANPKSTSWAVPSAPTMTLAGLTSRWKMPAEWAASRVTAMPTPMRSASARGSGPLGQDPVQGGARQMRLHQVQRVLGLTGIEQAGQPEPDQRAQRADLVLEAAARRDVQPGRVDGLDHDVAADSVEPSSRARNVRAARVAVHSSACVLQRPDRPIPPGEQIAGERGHRERRLALMPALRGGADVRLRWRRNPSTVPANVRGEIGLGR